MCEKFLVRKDAEELKRRLAAKGQDAIETVIDEILEGFSSNPNSGTDTVDYIMSMVVGEENDHVQSSPNNPGPSTMEIKSEMCHNTDEASDKSFESQSSSTGYTSAEIIDIPSDSDDDRDYYYCNTPDADDVSIIDTVKVECHTHTPHHTISLRKPLDLTNRLLNEMTSATASSDICSPLDLTNNRLLLNQVAAVTTSNYEQAVSNETQVGPKEEIMEENNNDVIYTKHVYKKKRSSKRPKPGCSKNFDDATPEIENVCHFSNLDELLKDAKIIHAILPRFSYRLIYRMLCNNQFARNRIELTLWDLLPTERPPAQLSQYKRKSDEVCFIKCKKSSRTVLEKAQVDTNTSLEKKEQVCTTNEEIVADTVRADIESENKEKIEILLTDENGKMEWNMPETAVLDNTSNDTNQQSEASIKIEKLDYTTDEPMQGIESSNNINTVVIQDSKKPKVASKTEELQSTKKSEVKNKSELLLELLPDNKVPTNYIPTVRLQPAKLTLDSVIPTSSPLQKFQRFYKPLISVLSPPKLNLIAGSSAVPRATNVVQIQPITSHTSNLTCNASTRRLLNCTSSNDKEASRIPTISYPNIGDPFRPTAIWHEPFVSKTPDVFAPPKNMEMEGLKLADVYPAVLPASFCNQPSSSTETAQNISDRQKASSSTSSKANYNLEQEGGSMSTSQVYNRGNEKQGTMNAVKERQLQKAASQYLFPDAQPKKHLSLIANVENASKEKPKDTAKDANPKEIILNEKANKIYAKLIPMFPRTKTTFIKQLCHNYVKDDGQSQNEASLLETLVEMLLNCDQENLVVEKAKPLPVAEEPNPTYDMNEQYADLLMIFPEADPVYLREITEQMYSDPERIKEFVQSKLENPDYPTRTQYLAKKKITEQQKQYTTDFKVEQFLEMFPDPFSYFEDNKRKCQFNPHAVDFLKYYFIKIRVNTLVKVYAQYMHNLSLTANALEALNPDMKTKRYCNKMALTEDIPFLQECAFIQHKMDLRKYLDKVKTKEEQEFNELKKKNELLECQCCYDNECMPSKCSTCEDGHIFCNLCIVRSTDVVLGDGNTRIDCLLKCGCEFPISVLQRVLPPTKFSILLCKRQEAEVIAAGLEGLISCPFCHFASIPPPEDKIFKCLNPECMKESCRLCKELNHIPLKCNEKKSESARLYLEEKMTEALIRKCYRCSRMFFKEEGCNKMTCICGAQMCYICDKPVTDYKHFQGQGAERSNLCPLWSDDRRLNAESVIKVCQETMKQMKEKDPEININVNGLLPKLPPKSKGPHEDIGHGAMMRLHDRFARQFP